MAAGVGVEYGFVLFLFTFFSEYRVERLEVWEKWDLCWRGRRTSREAAVPRLTDALQQRADVAAVVEAGVVAAAAPAVRRARVVVAERAQQACSARYNLNDIYSVFEPVRS